MAPRPQAGDEASVRPLLLGTLARKNNEARKDYTAYVCCTRFPELAFKGDRSDLVDIARKEQWKFDTIFGGQVFVKETSESPATLLKISQYFTKNGYQSSVMKHDPFDDWIEPASIASPRRNGLSYLDRFMFEAELVSAEEIGSGKTKASFVRRANTITISHTIIFSKASGNMPVEVEIRLQDSRQGMDVSEYITYGRYSWKNMEGLWLPIRIEANASFISLKETTANEIDLQIAWKIGDQISDTLFTDLERDPRESLGEQFGFDFDKYNEIRQRVYEAENPWSVPEVKKR